MLSALEGTSSNPGSRCHAVDLRPFRIGVTRRNCGSSIGIAQGTCRCLDRTRHRRQSARKTRAKQRRLGPAIAQLQHRSPCHMRLIYVASARRTTPSSIRRSTRRALLSRLIRARPRDLVPECIAGPQRQETQSDRHRVFIPTTTWVGCAKVIDKGCPRRAHGFGNRLLIEQSRDISGTRSVPRRRCSRAALISLSTSASDPVALAFPYPTSQAVTAQAEKRRQKKDTAGTPPTHA